MNRPLSVKAKERLLSGLARATTLPALLHTLGPRFVCLSSGPVDGAITWVHRDSLTIIEGPVRDGHLYETASLIDGEDARLYLVDLFERSPSLDDLVNSLAEIYGSSPGVLEAFKRGRRLWVSGTQSVIEIRGKKTEFTVRILDAESAFSALDAATRMMPGREALELVVGSTLALEPNTSTSILLLKDGAVGFLPLPSGGYGLLTDNRLCEAFMESVQPGSSIEECDARIRHWSDYYGRTEQITPSGEPLVNWRLPSLGLDFIWHRGELQVKSI